MSREIERFKKRRQIESAAINLSTLTAPGLQCLDPVPLRYPGPLRPGRVGSMIGIMPV
jgi:hypothetical protein